MSGNFSSDVVCALPGRQTLSTQSAPEWVTVAEAIRLCGILDRYPEIGPAAGKPGIFGTPSRSDAWVRGNAGTGEGNSEKNDGGEI